MTYWEITIQTASAGIALLAEKLTAGGFEDLVLEDQQELEGFLDQNRAYWDYIDETLQEKLQGLSQIKLYLEAGDQAGLAQIQGILDAFKAVCPEETRGSLELTVTPLAETNYEESWKENYPPQPIGEKLVVLPYWLADDYKENRLPVILDPGLTFGTGAHASTQMVMAAMEKLDLKGASCLDLGSGSGILSIAALRLGAKAAAGVDIDPKAETIARENAAYNGYGSETFTAFTGNVTTDKKLMAALQEKDYDLVLVNIVADVIISLCPVLPQLLKEDSHLLLSGILHTRLNEVLSALEQAGLTAITVYSQDDWRCVYAKRRCL